MKEPQKAGVRRFCRIFLLGLLALFFTPVASLTETGSARAQSYPTQSRYIKRGVPRKRLVVRHRQRFVRKPKKSFFGGLFSSKPAPRRRSGIKPLFSSFKMPGRANQDPAALRAIYEKKMREAAKRKRDLMNVPRNAGRQNVSQGWGRGKYRTMCVRMCDGYYFPVRFKARSRNFENDEEHCNSECYNAPTKLFYYSNPGGSIEEMHSLDGVRYKDIANAFRYRKEYVADCRCKAEPWTPQARQQHESWAQEAEDRSMTSESAMLDDGAKINTAEMELAKNGGSLPQ